MKPLILKDRSEVLAVIDIKSNSHIIAFKPTNEEAISEYLYSTIGSKVNEYDSPLYIEASCWCSTAIVGSSFECEDFTINIMESDEVKSI